MSQRGVAGSLVGMVMLISAAHASGDLPDPAAAERGRRALTLTGYLKAGWTEEAYRKAGKFWKEGAPDPITEPDAYAAAFRRHYGLHPAPYPNDGLPMGIAGPRAEKALPQGSRSTA